MLLWCCLHISPHPSSSAIVYRLERCSLQAGERGSDAMLADGCLYFKKHLDILLHLSPITSCLPLHLSLSAWLSVHPSLPLTLSLPSSLSLSLFFFPASYFSWFIVRQGVSVRPGLPLCVCEGVLLFMVLPAINHVSSAVEDGGEKWRSMDRWYTRTRKKKDRSRRSRLGRRGLLSRFSSSFFSYSVFAALLSFSSSISDWFPLMPSPTPSAFLHLIITRGVFFFLAQYESGWL